MATNALTKPRAPTKGAQLAQLRADVARALAITPDDLREWNTRRCAACGRDTLRSSHCAASDQPHLPPLYYVLAPETCDGDMPLGIGATPRAALADLLWSIRAQRLLADIFTPEP